MVRHLFGYCELFIACFSLFSLWNCLNKYISFFIRHLFYLEQVAFECYISSHERQNLIVLANCNFFQLSKSVFANCFLVIYRHVSDALKSKLVVKSFLPLERCTVCVCEFNWFAIKVCVRVCCHYHIVVAGIWGCLAWKLSSCCFD